MRRLHNPREPGWSPYLYLLYLVFLFFQPTFSHPGWGGWCLTGAAAIVGGALYLAGALYKGTMTYWCVAGLLTLGYAFFPWNGGASCFLIYAVALFAFRLSPRAAFLAVGSMSVGISIESWLLHLAPGPGRRPSFSWTWWASPASTLPRSGTPTPSSF